MIYNNVYRDVGTLSPYTPFRQIAPLVLAGIVSAAGSALAGGANALSTNAANKRNIANQNELWEKQKAYQNWLNANGALIQKQSLQRAGFNPNSAFGTSANLQAPTPQKSDMQPTDFSFLSQAGSDVAHMIQQQPLVDAQARETNANAERTEIENKNLKSENATYENIDNVLQEFSSDGFKTGVLPEVVVIPKNKGWFTAMRNINEFRGEKSDISFKLVQNELNKMVAEGQIKDPKTIDALRDLPYWITQKLMEETELAIAHASESRANKEYIDSNKAYVDLKKRLEEDNNIMPYIDKIFQGEFNFESFVKMLVLIGAKQLSK